jgi:hypothetical protein
MKKYAALSVAATVLLTAAAQAGPVSVSPMLELFGSGNIPAADDQSTLRRTPRFIDVEVDTSGLDPLSSYTIWAFIFNAPEFCASSPCSLADAAFSPGHDPRVRSSGVFATGGVADADGHGLFLGEVWKANQGVTGAQVLFGPGLLDTRKAEIHIVVRGHGQPTADADFFASIASFTGGCNDANAVQPPCEDQQVSVHTAN